MLATVESITIITSNIAVVVGIVIAILQLQKMQVSNDLQQREFLADHERRKKQATIEFSHQVLEERAKAAEKINAIFKDGAVINVSAQDYIDDLDDVRGSITRYLNLMERISVGINTGVYDLSIFMRITGYATVTFYKRIEPVISERRRESQRQTMYCDFEKFIVKLLPLGPVTALVFFCFCYCFFSRAALRGRAVLRS